MRAKGATALVALAALTASACGSARAARGGAPTTPAAASKVASRTFPDGFVPAVMAAAGGYVWVVGTAATGCVANRVNPSNLAMTPFPLPYCSGYLASDPGHLYLPVGRPQAGTDVQSFSLEVLDTATGQARVMSPTVATASGSDGAHLSFAYGAGQLWLYNWEASRLVEVSPTTGSAGAAVGGVNSGGGHAVIAATAGAVWVAEGPGGPHLYRIPAGSPTATTVFTGPAPGSLLWVVEAGDRLWAASAAFGAGTSFTTSLVAFDASGHQVRETPPVAVGEADAVGAGSWVWSVGTGGACDDPQRLWRTDTATGATAAAATLASPVEACLALGPDHLAVAGGYVFVLDTTGSASPAGVLYRVSG